MSDHQKGGILVDSEELSQCSNYESVTKGSDGEVKSAEHDGNHSDYGDEDRGNLQALDSADEEHVDEHDEENGSRSESRSGSGSDSDSVIVEDEREDGDGQESLPAREKKLDDDEDRRNPQYIPKKGTFYEHDDRTADDGESKEREGKEGTKEREGKEPGKENSGRKIWKEREDRWKHDRFQETEQMPKSREELLQVYGYDIRSEESPPKARRRRRYGRGPNKYTRSWEDEAAYGRPLSAFIVDKEGPGDGDGDGDGDRDRDRAVRATAGVGRRKGPSNRGASGEASRGRPPRKDRPRQDFPALTPQADHAAAENGQKMKLEPQSSTFSTKLGGDNRVAGSFKMNPRDVIPPFRNQQFSSATTQSQDARHLDKGSTTVSQQGSLSHSNKSEDGNKRSWRREDGDDSRRQGSGRIEGRPRPQSGGVRRRSGDWQDQNGPNRGSGSGRGRPVRSGDSGLGRASRPGENGHQSDGGSQNYVENVRKDLGSLTITNSQHQQSSQQGGSSSGADFVRRPSNGGGNNPPSNNGAPSNNSNYRQAVVPPRMQESASSRPKRYSSVRPRNMPEATMAVSPGQQGPGQGQGQGPNQSAASGPVGGAVAVPVAGPVPVPVPAPGPGPSSLPGAVPGSVPVAGAGSGGTPPPPPVTSPYTASAHSYYQPGYPQPIYGDTTGQQPVPSQVVVEASGAAQLMVRPPQAVAGVAGVVAPPPFPAGFPQPPPPYMTPPPGPSARLLPATSYMAPAHPAAAPPPQPINFVGAPNGQGQFQSLAFQTYQPIAMVVSSNVLCGPSSMDIKEQSQVNQPQPQEMYQRQSGITYYSPQNQAVPRAVPQPRVKAAIPIVPPPELASRHRGSDEGELSGEHDPASLGHSSSPGPTAAPAGVPLSVPLVLPVEASGQPVCYTPPEAQAIAPSPSGAPSQRFNEETVPVIIEAVMPAALNPTVLSAEPSLAPERTPESQQSEVVEPATQPS